MKELCLLYKTISNKPSYLFGQVVSLDTSVFHFWRRLYKNEIFVSYAPHAALALPFPWGLSPIDVANPDLDGMWSFRAS